MNSTQQRAMSMVHEEIELLEGIVEKRNEMLEAQQEEIERLQRKVDSLESEFEDTLSRVNGK